jgi:Glycine zipper 2TM domain
MRKILPLIATAALVALPMAFGPTTASASCSGRTNTGTVLGGIGGALVGSSVTRGSTGGTILGGLGGAVVGHQIAKGGCGRTVTRYRTTSARTAQAQPQPARRVYYDQYGNPVGQVVQTASAR